MIIDEITTLKQLPLHRLPVISEDYPLWDLLRLFQVRSFLFAILQRTNLQANFNCDPSLGRRFSVRLFFSTSTSYLA